MKFDPQLPAASRSTDIIAAAIAGELRSVGSGARSAGHEHNDLLTALATSINRSVGKRLLDIIGALGLLILLVPLLAAIALAIKLTSPGPVIFRQQRYGENRRVFSVLKFRTMTVSEAAGAFVQARPGDARITPVGALLRRVSLDELPQLFNVLEGSMSLVGPRPHATPMDDYYDDRVSYLWIRHLVRPGLTGLAQVKSLRGPTENDELMAMRAAHDVFYIIDWSLLNDLRILLRTPLALSGHNAV